MSNPSLESMMEKINVGHSSDSNITIRYGIRLPGDCCPFFTSAGPHLTTGRTARFSALSSRMFESMGEAESMLRLVHKMGVTKAVLTEITIKTLSAEEQLSRKLLVLHFKSDYLWRHSCIALDSLGWFHYPPGRLYCQSIQGYYYRECIAISPRDLSRDSNLLADFEVLCSRIAHIASRWGASEDQAWIISSV